MRTLTTVTRQLHLSMPEGVGFDASFWVREITLTMTTGGDSDTEKLAGCRKRLFDRDRVLCERRAADEQHTIHADRGDADAPETLPDWLQKCRIRRCERAA